MKDLPSKGMIYEIIQATFEVMIEEEPDDMELDTLLDRVCHKLMKGDLYND